MILRLLNVQGIAGIAISLCLGGLLLLQKAETRRWTKRAGSFEQLYRGESAAHAGTVASYRAAADAARAADRANALRVAAEQKHINERIENEFEARLAAARAAAVRLREPARAAAADSRDGGAAGMPGLSAASGATSQIAEDRFPDSDRLLATEQAIQLDALIEWVKAQARVEPTVR
jgi:hypothetical protein